MKHLLITGGCGFIGSNFIRHILHKYSKYRVRNLDKLTYAGNLSNLKDISSNSRYKFIKGDICDASLVGEAMKGVDWVVHFAAETHVDRSLDCAAPFLRTNVTGTWTLLESARRHRLSRFVHISTDEVYGSAVNGRFREDDPLAPSSPYSASKAAADLLVNSYLVTYHLPALIIRPSNNFGPYQYPEKVIPLFITNALEGKRLPLYGDGLNVREWLYVSDNCEAIDLVLHKGKAGEVYNVGTSNTTTNLALTKAILKKMEKPFRLVEYVTDRLGHDRRYALDSSKIKALGWRPRHNFNEALRETINWYRDNERWWGPLKGG